MNRADLRRTPPRNGFTLIEVVVVLVILAILAAIVIPGLRGWIQKANEKRVLVACRACAVSAQALMSEAYAESGGNKTKASNLGLFFYPSAYGEEGSGDYLSVPTGDAVLKMAGIENGSVSGITAVSKTATLDTLTYSDGKGNWATYINNGNEPYYVYSDGGVQWATGQTYKVGDLMTSHGYIFKCIRAHTTGTTSRTRDPSLRSNKSTWIVVGWTGDPLPYSSTVRYAEGTTVTYKGKTYVRTDFNLVGGQVPYDNSSSDYWILTGDAEP